MNIAPTSTSLELIVGARNVIDRVLPDLKQAERSIDVAMFSLKPSGTGWKLVEALKDRARAGVEVRLHVDAVGSWSTPGIVPGKRFSDMARELADAGAQLIINKRWGPTDRPPAWPAIDHRKLVVVDDSVAYAGGINFAGEFDSWHDVMVRAEGAVATQARAAFEQRWQSAGGAASRLPVARLSAVDPSQPAGGADNAAQGARVLVNEPGGRLDLTAALYDAVSKAQNRVWVQSPQLSSPEFAKALSEAAARGVDVRVALPGNAETAAPVLRGVMRGFANSFRYDLHRSGVRIYEQPSMSHAKVFLVDDTAFVGSNNVSRRAELFDHEIAIEESGGQLSQQVEELFHTDFRRSREQGPAELASPLSRISDAVKDVLGFGY